MKNLIIYLSFLILVSCGSNKKPHFNNELLINEIDTFIDSSQNIGMNEECKYILMYWDKFMNKNSISLHHVNPVSFENLYCVINYRDFSVLVYSDYDISKYIYTSTPYDIDTSTLKKVATNNSLGINWYSSGFYFDGVEIYNPSSVTNEASYPEGSSAFVNFLKSQIKYPANAIENNIEGQVITTFDISKTGKIQNLNILRGIGFGCDEKVIETIKQIPKLNPKTIFDNPINSSSSIRITFVLDSLDIEVELGVLGEK